MDPSSYLSKCSSFVLYITLIGVAFLGSFNFAAPIYGFAAYRFIAAELTCSLDHHAHFACPYALYTLLLVQGPIYFPLIYWTVHLSFKKTCSHYNHSQNSSSSNPLFLNKNNSLKLQSLFSHSKSFFLVLFCCCKNVHQSSQAQCFKESNRYKQSSSKLISQHPVVFQTTSSFSSSRLAKKQIKSNVLTASKEVSTVLITGWLFLLSYSAKLLHNGFVACRAPSTYPLITDEMPTLPIILVAMPANDTERKLTFYISFFDETVSCVILPFILIFFHSKLRHSLNCILKCLFFICCGLCLKKQKQSNLNIITVQSVKKPDSTTSMKKSLSIEFNSNTQGTTSTLNQSINLQVNCYKNNNYESNMEITVV